jgi:hypothetical protein
LYFPEFQQFTHRRAQRNQQTIKPVKSQALYGKKGQGERRRPVRLSFFAGTAVSCVRIAVVHPGVLDFRVASVLASALFNEFAHSFIERPELLNIFSKNPRLFAATSILKG